MSVPAAKPDLLVLVADRNTEAAVRGILSREESLGIRKPSCDIRRHPEQDSGCRVDGCEYLKTFVNQYERAILIFDHEGCGDEKTLPQDLEARLESDLAEAGWRDRSAVIVLAPELEIWVWSDSPHVDIEMGWAGRRPDLRAWLRAKGFLRQDQIKPARPKEAVEAALRLVRKPRSSTLYQALAQEVSLVKCKDRAFLKLKTTLQTWFPNA